MCGICGLIQPKQKSSAYNSEHVVIKMREKLTHRGPDQSGEWFNKEEEAYFGHRRRSVIDLSENGRQPMVSKCGNYVITYNGEVYNYGELKKELLSAGYSFSGQSDTEVVLAACTIWGVRKAVDRMIGMFAFSIWDRRLNKLSLVRDRLGIKPLYWYYTGKQMAFASELKSFSAIPDWNPEINHHAFSSYIRYGYVPSPVSIYENVSKLPPGSILTWVRDQSPQIEKYWDPLTFISNSSSDIISDEEAANELEVLLNDAVKKRMISDVPLGSMLSGGIDSSIVTAFMQKNNTQPIKSYSIGFHETDYNEAQYASKVAEHLKTDHTELYLEPKHAIDLIPNLPEIYDEPFADSSQIPTYLISKLLGQHVTVGLSGDGGDELFAGYNRYQWAGKFALTSKILPNPIRTTLVKMINSLSPLQWDSVFKLLPQKFKYNNIGDKLYKVASILPLNNEQTIYRELVSQWSSPGEIIRDAQEIKTVAIENNLKNTVSNFTSRMQLMDMISYLPDDILVKLDRASMAVGLEARVPLLDHRIVEFALKLPIDMKQRNGKSKWLLRQLLHRYVPSEIVERPKMGFSIPIGDWLRGPLREWSQDLLSSEQLKKHDFFKSDIVQTYLNEHMKGHRNHQYKLWVLLMFQSWYLKWHS